MFWNSVHSVFYWWVREFWLGIGSFPEINLPNYRYLFVPILMKVAFWCQLDETVLLNVRFRTAIIGLESLVVSVGTLSWVPKACL